VQPETKPVTFLHFALNGITSNGYGEGREADPTKNTIPQFLRPRYEDVARVAHTLKAQGMNLTDIRDELNRQGYRTRTGRQWKHATQVSKLLRSFPQVAV
jgi:hypothetical protein